jgi:hypothetical protein
MKVMRFKANQTYDLNVEEKMLAGKPPRKS